MPQIITTHINIHYSGTRLDLSLLELGSRKGEPASVVDSRPAPNVENTYC